MTACKYFNVNCSVKWLQKYTGFLRNLRAVHGLYNLFHRKGLRHNKHLYPYYGIQRSVYRSISASFFAGKGAKKPWLDNFTGARDIENHPLFTHFPDAVEQQLLQWNRQGYLIWENFLDAETVDAINQDIEDLMGKNAVDFNYTGRKIFNTYRQSAVVRKVIKEKRLLELLSFILDKPVVPFQTIHFLKGSEQQPHSDAIHMSTFPQGYMIAAWFALEDIGPEQGPLSYFPGSQQLPYLTNADYDNDSNCWRVDGEANAKYEQKIAQLLAENNFPKMTFTAKKGDLLIWHGNLIHGGEPMLRREATRKSMVAHYYAKDVICYHEISERPAIFDTDLIGEIDNGFYKGDSDILDIPKF